MSDIQRRWDLWPLKTLFPHWGDRERARLLREGAAFDARQQALFADPGRAARRLLPEARRFLAAHPDLAGGLVLSLHLGPYSLAPVPWLAAGQDVHLLINRSSLAEIRPIYDALHAVVGLSGRIHWVPIEGQGFALGLLRALRRGEPVFAFLDGNDGLDGCAGTLRHGIVHQLPGRAIRVRTGLARLAVRLQCPVHSVVTVWPSDGTFTWQRGPSWRWPGDMEAAAATGELFTWAFSVIGRHPAQWRAWNMLTAVCDDFRPEAGDRSSGIAERAVLPPAHQLLHWRRPAMVWPGDMLEDVDGNCFYDAAGLKAAQLARLVTRSGFTAAGTAAWFGADWPGRHLPRLLALGFVGPDSPGPAEPADAPRRSRENGFTG